MGDQMITVNGESGMITLSGLGDSDSDEDVMGGTELKIGPDGTIMNMGDLSGMRHQVVAAEDGTVTLVVTEDLDEDDEDDAGQHQYSINGKLNGNEISHTLIHTLILSVSFFPFMPIRFCHFKYHLLIDPPLQRTERSRFA